MKNSKAEQMIPSETGKIRDQSVHHIFIIDTYMKAISFSSWQDKAPEISAKPAQTVYIIPTGQSVITT